MQEQYYKDRIHQELDESVCKFLIQTIDTLSFSWGALDNKKVLYHRNIIQSALETLSQEQLLTVMKGCMGFYNPKLELTIFDNNFTNLFNNFLKTEQAKKRLSSDEMAIESISLGSFLYRYCQIDFYKHMALKHGSDMGLRENIIVKVKSDKPNLNGNSLQLKELGVLDLAMEKINAFLKGQNPKAWRLNGDLIELVELTNTVDAKNKKIDSINETINSIIAPLTLQDIKNSFYSDSFLESLETHCDSVAQQEVVGSSIFQQYCLMHYICTYVKKEPRGELSYVKLNRLIAEKIKAIDINMLGIPQIQAGVQELRESFTGKNKISKRDEEKIRTSTQRLMGDKLVEFCNTAIVESEALLYKQHANVKQTQENKDLYEKNKILFQKNIINLIEHKVDSLAQVYCQIHPEYTFEVARSVLVDSLFTKKLNGTTISLAAKSTGYLFSDAVQQKSFTEKLLLTLKSQKTNKALSPINKI